MPREFAMACSLGNQTSLPTWRARAWTDSPVAIGGAWKVFWQAQARKPCVRSSSPWPGSISRFSSEIIAEAEAALSATKAADFPGGGYVTPREWYEALVAQGLGQAEKAQTAFTGRPRTRGSERGETPGRCQGPNDPG